MKNLKFIEKLSQKEFEELSLLFFQDKGVVIISFDALQIVKEDEDKIIIDSKSRIPYGRTIEFDDFCAEYKTWGGFSVPTPNKKKSNILRDYLYNKYGKEYLKSLKEYLEKEKARKIAEIEKEYKNEIDELIK